MSVEGGLSSPGVVPSSDPTNVADDEGEPVPQQPVKQAPPEVEIVVDAPDPKPIPSQEAANKEKEALADGVSEEPEPLKRELEETDGSSIPAKYAEAVMAVDNNQG